METILVADDDPITKSIVKQMLIKLGYSVIDAEDGAKALELYNVFISEIDLAILDYQMPELTGPQVAQQLDVPCVFMTMEPEELQKELLALGISDAPIIKKPVTLNSLSGELEKLVF